uniref:Sec-independent protein translocase n=1 Tax=Sheathia arcuata TaxID=340433 RepID=A0A343UY16_9FLOR|nr:Sec-independent protein translocase [Sheathia arcuata]
MYPLIIYFKEIFWRIFYCILSLILIVIISFYYIEFIFLFELYPLIKLSHKKFIATHITELFDSVLQMCFFMISINGFPLIAYHIFTFFKSSWFNYQITLVWRYLFILLILVYLSFFFTNIFLLPQMYNFFTQWEMFQESKILHISLEARIYLYLQWINCTYNSISFFFSLSLIILFLILLFLPPYKFYLFIKLYKKQILFIQILILFILSPPDFWVQVFLVFASSLLLEFFFFISCFRVNQTKKILGSSIGRATGC